MCNIVIEAKKKKIETVKDLLTFDEYLDEICNEVIEAGIEIGLSRELSTKLMNGTKKGLKNYYKGTIWEKLIYRREKDGDTDKP